MNRKSAIARYLERYAEPEIALAEQVSGSFEHAVVIPAYAESGRLMDAIDSIPAKESAIVIIVVNEPEDAPADAREQSIQSIRGLEQASSDNGSLFWVERTHRTTPIETKQGVGLARKIGCDIALSLHRRGRISGRFIHTTDADVRLPARYLSASDGVPPDTVALTYPFEHRAHNEDERPLSKLGARYDRYLQHYVDGLRFAGSPYAHHSVGSTLAVDVDAYAQVRGIPRRAAGEDFHLLNKLRKIGEVQTPLCEPISLSCRGSDRTPFGTGMTLERWNADSDGTPCFYHPDLFEGVRRLLNSEASWSADESASMGDDTLAGNLHGVIEELGLREMVRRSQQSATTATQRAKMFHLTIDALQTLRVIHALERRGYPRQDQPMLPGEPGR